MPVASQAWEQVHYYPHFHSQNTYKLQRVVLRIAVLASWHISWIHASLLVGTVSLWLCPSSSLSWERDCMKSRRQSWSGSSGRRESMASANSTSSMLPVCLDGRSSRQDSS